MAERALSGVVVRRTDLEDEIDAVLDPACPTSGASIVNALVSTGLLALFCGIGSDGAELLAGRLL